MPRKYWTPEEEQRLRGLWESGVHNFKLLAGKIGRSGGAVRQKCRRLGVEVVVQNKPQKPRTTTSTVLPSDIVTHERVLKVLAGAMKKASEPSLDIFEIMRLNVLIDASKTYDSVLEKFALTIEEPQMTSVEARKFAKKEIVRHIQTEHKYYVSKKLFAPPRIRTLRPFKKDIEILDSRLVYVPYAAFKLRVKDKVYQRTSQAATKKMLLDETYRCYACENRAKLICERCGNLACFRHCKRCVSCNKIICNGCTITQGVFRRKDYCHECVPE